MKIAAMSGFWMSSKIWFLILGFLTADAALGFGISRCDFPKGFSFGVASSALQYEGAASEDGRQPSIWDAFAAIPGKIEDASRPNLTTDQYHRYKEDVMLLKNMGVDFYRFSISWSRVYNDRQVNPEGVAYYNSLIDTLIENGIKPFVTLYHWDLPQALEDSIGGWLSRDIVDEFVSFAEVCFQAFGDRVKHWLTFNEPHMFIKAGYYDGDNAPGHCSLCSRGDSNTEPYIAGHNVLRAHAKATETYRQKYKAKQNGVIGMTFDSFWYEPFSRSPDDIAAAERALEFELGWFLHPVIYGDYPPLMREAVGLRLPVFTKSESRALVKSMDFVGLNHYTSRYIQNDPEAAAKNSPGYATDRQTRMRSDKNGIIIGQGTGSWLYVVPWGFRRLLNYIKDNYNNPPLFVTENGYVDVDSASPVLNDESRVAFFKSYLASLREAMRDGVDVRAYLAWSLLDNWELQHGYRFRFGLHYVDFTTLKRYPKLSALWFQKFLAKDKCDRVASI